MAAIKTCPGYTSDDGSYAQVRHDLPNDETNFSPGKSQCRDCYRQYAADWRERRGQGTGGSGRRQVRKTVILPDFRAPALEGAASAEEFVSDEDMAASRSHEYRPIPGLIETWGAVTNAAAAGAQPFNLIFLGPSGCGKTEGAAFLAALVGLPFTKVDAASMTDPESWFGTREVIAEDGVSVTSYYPSNFVTAIESPGVLLIDEINRAKDGDRNVLLPLFDGTHQVTNPLTGEVVKKHPRCFVIMSGNRGLQFTGTYAVDPALMTRSLTVNFDYAAPVEETKIALQASGCDDVTADLFVRFADESRKKAKLDADFSPISTREVILASRMVACGLTADAAARFVVINAASPEGGAASVAASLENIWAAVRTGAASVALVPCTESRWGEQCRKMAPHEGESHESAESGYEW